MTALVEILNALVNASSSILPQVAPHYLKMLLCEVSFAFFFFLSAAIGKYHVIIVRIRT